MRPATLTLLLAALTASAPSAQEAAPGGERQSMSLPGLGGNSRIDCQVMDYEGSTGRLHARGSVAVRSDDFNIDCEELIYDEAGHSMSATGQRVQIQMGELVAVGGTLNYNTESGSMTLERGAAADQPYVVQQQEGSVFTAWADTIVIDQDASGEAVTRFEGNVQVRTTSETTPAEGPATP